MNHLKCPVCPDTLLVKHDENGTTVDYCENCGGLWLEEGELNKITRPHDGDIEFSIHEHAGEGEPTEKICPVCSDKPLVTKNFIEYSDIKIESCDTCGGVWLDKGELDAVNAEIDKLNSVPDTFTHKLMVFLSKLPFN